MKFFLLMSSWFYTDIVKSIYKQDVIVCFRNLKFDTSASCDVTQHLLRQDFVNREVSWFNINILIIFCFILYLLFFFHSTVKFWRMAESHVSGGLSEHSIDLFQVSLQMRFSLNMLIEFWYQVPDFNELFIFQCSPASQTEIPDLPQILPPLGEKEKSDITIKMLCK